MRKSIFFVSLICISMMFLSACGSAGLNIKLPPSSAENGNGPVRNYSEYVSTDQMATESADSMKTSFTLSARNPDYKGDDSPGSPLPWLDAVPYTFDQSTMKVANHSVGQYENTTNDTPSCDQVRAVGYIFFTYPAMGTNPGEKSYGQLTVYYDSANYRFAGEVLSYRCGTSNMHGGG